MSVDLWLHIAAYAALAFSLLFAKNHHEVIAAIAYLVLAVLIIRAHANQN